MWKAGAATAAPQNGGAAAAAAKRHHKQPTLQFRCGPPPKQASPQPRAPLVAPAAPWKGLDGDVGEVGDSHDVQRAVERAGAALHSHQRDALRALLDGAAVAAPSGGDSPFPVTRGNLATSTAAITRCGWVPWAKIVPEAVRLMEEVVTVGDGQVTSRWVAASQQAHAKEELVFGVIAVAALYTAIGRCGQGNLHPLEMFCAGDPLAQERCVACHPLRHHQGTSRLILALEACPAARALVAVVNPSFCCAGLLAALRVQQISRPPGPGATGWDWHAATEDIKRGWAAATSDPLAVAAACRLVSKTPRRARGCSGGRGSRGGEEWQDTSSYTDDDDDDDGGSEWSTPDREFVVADDDMVALMPTTRSPKSKADKKKRRKRKGRGSSSEGTRSPSPSPPPKRRRLVRNRGAP